MTKSSLHRKCTLSGRRACRTSSLPGLSRVKSAAGSPLVVAIMSYVSDGSEGRNERWREAVRCNLYLSVWEGEYIYLCRGGKERGCCTFIYLPIGLTCSRKTTIANFCSLALRTSSSKQKTWVWSAESKTGEGQGAE